MTVVVDTNVFVDHLRAAEPASEALREAAQRGRVAASVLSRIELRRGVRPHQLDGVELLDGFVDWVPVDHEIARLAARHAERFGRSHRAIDAIDYVIAATSQRLEARLLTRNVRHFPMIEGLRAPY